MKKAKLYFLFIGIFICLCLNWYVIRSEKYLGNPIVDLCMVCKSQIKYEMQLYYDMQNQDNWSEENSNCIQINKGTNKSVLLFNSQCNKIRLDFGNESNEIEIQKMYLKYKNIEVPIPLKIFKEAQIVKDMSIKSVSEKDVKLKVEGIDPYIVLNLSDVNYLSKLQEKYKTTEHHKNIFICMFIDLFFAVVLYWFSNIYNFGIEIVTSKKLMFSLALNDFKTRYAGSYLGIIWAFIQPVVTILVYWFVFQVGFKSGPVNDCPYILWFMAGLIPWFFFSEAISTATNSMIEYNYLVKKVVFKIKILPIVKIISALFVHMFFVAILLLLFLVGGYFHIYLLQVIYYSICMIMLALGISYFTSAIVVFFRDLGQIISIILQVGMWLTPIMWNYTIIPVKVQWILKINPMFYVVNGYRNSLIMKKFFLADIRETIYFWTISFILFYIGIRVFDKLKIHFADVL